VWENTTLLPVVPFLYEDLIHLVHVLMKWLLRSQFWCRQIVLLSWWKFTWPAKISDVIKKRWILALMLQMLYTCQVIWCNYKEVIIGVGATEVLSHAKLSDVSDVIRLSDKEMAIGIGATKCLSTCHVIWCKQNEFQDELSSVFVSCSSKDCGGKLTEVRNCSCHIMFVAPPHSQYSNLGWKAHAWVGTDYVWEGLHRCCRCSCTDEM